jgi:serine/threonine protein phosphatase PrpC
MTTYFAKTDPGLIRDLNEDCYGIDGQSGLWLVADGVGGQKCGEIASEIAKSTIIQEFVKGETIPRCIESAHDAILNEIKKSPDKSGMGSTVVALSIQGDTYEIAWIGDSRAYLWDGQLTMLTTDHTYVADLVQKGLLSSAAAKVHPKRHVITQSLGVWEEMRLEVGLVTGTLEKGQQFLLCSDGLTGEVSDTRIAAIMESEPVPEAQVTTLMAEALEAGGRDNITIISVAT